MAGTRPGARCCFAPCPRSPILHRQNGRSRLRPTFATVLPHGDPRGFRHDTWLILAYATAEARLNIEPTLGLLEIAREEPPARIVFLSSGGTVYGGATETANEQLSLLAHSYHGAGKIALEAFLDAFAWDTGCSLVLLRPSNVYGPGQEMRRGFGFVRGALECALHGGALEIWGDGMAIRDFLYIDDLVAAVTDALAASEVDGKFNVASGVGHTLNEVVDIVRRVSGRPIMPVYRGGRRSDIRKVSLDVSLVEHHLGWRARVDLEHGIALTWQWLCAV